MTSYTKKEINEWLIDNGVDTRMVGEYVTKEQCPHGYTETLPIHLLEELIK